jgi:hypothetical protein
MKIVGTQNRSEIELNPQRAWQRGKVLDAMLRGATTQHPRGVWRLTHAQMNQMDFERQLAQAAKINGPAMD